MALAAFRISSPDQVRESEPTHCVSHQSQRQRTVRRQGPFHDLSHLPLCAFCLLHGVVAGLGELHLPLYQFRVVATLTADSLDLAGPFSDDPHSLALSQNALRQRGRD